ncbi:MAG: DUF3267 domain-containing protein [Bacteroidales bacterium]|jgi:hypothetical protein
MEYLEGYDKEKLTIDIVWANVFGLLIFIPVIIVYGLPFYIIWSDGFTRSALTDFLDTLTMGEVAFGAFGMFLILIAGIVLHELIHGITWAIYAKKGFRSIRFGIMLKMLTPYCHCKEPLKVGQYIAGAIMPAVILGVVPAVAAIVTGHFGLLVFGIFFTAAACGDFLVINLLRKESTNSLVQDHPSEVGCYIYREDPNKGRSP